MENRVIIIDTTLRDGSHAVRHSFSVEQVKIIAGQLAKSGCKMIEISHGDGLGGSSFQYGLSKTSELELISAAGEEVKKLNLDTEIGCLLIPGIGTISHLNEAVANGISFVRVATHCTEADVAIQHIKAARKLGLKTFGFLMMVHMVSKETLLKQAEIFIDNGAEAVYFADSAGALLPNQIRDTLTYIKDNIDVPIGFHAHNNLGLATANSLAAFEAGALYLDATLRGLGAGAGNTAHEVIEAVLNKQGITSGADLYELMDAAEDCSNRLSVSMAIDKYALTLGYAGVYGSFYLHAKRAADRYGIDARDVLVELGRMKTVGGQEDMIMDVAFRLSQEGK